MNTRAVGVAAALGSGAAWAVGALLFKRIGEDMSSPAMTLTKGALSLVLLAIALVLVEGRSRTGERPFARLRTMDRKSLSLLVVSGFLGITIADTCFFEALSLLSAHSVVLLMMVGFILTPILAMVFLRERSTLGRWAGIVLVLAGTLGTALIAGESEGATRTRGIVLGLAAVISMSVSYVIAKKALRLLTAMQGTFIRMAIGTLGMLAFGLARGELGQWVDPLRDPQLALSFTAAVTVITFGGFWLTHVAIKNVDLTIANTLMATEPIFVLLIGVALLGDRPGLVPCLGTVVAMGGVALLFRETAEGAPTETQEEMVEASQ